MQGRAEEGGGGTEHLALSVMQQSSSIGYPRTLQIAKQVQVSVPDNYIT